MRPEPLTSRPLLESGWTFFQQVDRNTALESPLSHPWRLSINVKTIIPLSLSVTAEKYVRCRIPWDLFLVYAGNLRACCNSIKTPNEWNAFWGICFMFLSWRHGKHVAMPDLLQATVFFFLRICFTTLIHPRIYNTGDGSETFFMRRSRLRVQQVEKHHWKYASNVMVQYIMCKIFLADALF